VDLALVTRGDSLVFGDATEPATAPRPEHLREALVIGLTRMGILHNIARLTGDAAPDHADGGVAEWVVAERLRAADERQADAGIEFDITVSGQPAGAAVLTTGSDGLPAIRRQTVHFPEGDMHIVERYTRLDR
jgi:hypothetical protein